MSLVGKPAPDFTLEGYYNGKLDSYSLKASRGKWVYLLFYPLDFTFVCPTEVLSFSEHQPEFDKRGCQLFGVSVDSKFAHKAWVETKKAEGGLGGSLRYPLLADLKKEAATAYGVLEDGAVALRGLFLVNPEGTVMHATINFLPVGRSAKEALRTLKAFQYVSSHAGEVCPADWDEGMETMKANPEGMRAYLSAR
jgi:peroxiredoxin (alkyl hydroperoxide reductase subunit C)